jgi:hypothetical protein
MFWGIFSYDKIGSCYIYGPETVKMKKAAALEIKELNENLGPLMREDLSYRMLFVVRILIVRLRRRSQSGSGLRRKASLYEKEGEELIGIDIEKRSRFLRSFHLSKNVKKLDLGC